MTEIQQSRYDQLLRRVADLKGAGSKVNDVLEELFPVLDVERVPGELLWLSGTRLCVGASTGIGAVGETFRIQVFNPVGSGVLATVSTALFDVDAISNMRAGITTTALATGVGTEVFRDGRRAANAQPTCQIRTESTVAKTDANYFTRVIANVMNTLQDTNELAILSPGVGFEIGSDTTAKTIHVTFLWRERVAEPSELSF